MPRFKRLCPHCHQPVLDHAMRKHLNSCAPPTQVSEAGIKRRRAQGKAAPSADGDRDRRQPVAPKGSVKPTARPRLRITSKRATRVVGKRECSKCGRSSLETHRYAKSNRGVVYLCRGCHLKRHPGYLGVNVVRPYQGGGFGSK